MKIIKGIILGILVIAIILVFGLAYLGFVPGLSQLIGANKARDLGVKYTKTEYDTFSKKLNGDITPIEAQVSPDKSITYSGKLEVDNDFSQEELSSRLNYSRWKYMPIKNVQIKINSDSTVELSANLSMSRLPGFIEREGMGQYSMDDVTKGMEFLKVIKTDPPIYMKFKASITDNKLSGAFESMQVGKVNVPLEKVKANEAAISVFETIVSKIPSFYAKSVSFGGGKMHYTGTVPSQMSVEVEK